MKKQSPAFLLISDRNYLPAVLRILDAASESIEIMAYAFSTVATSRYDSPKQIVSKLKEITSANEDLRVRIFLEGHRDTQTKNRKTAALLKASGIEVQFGSTHVKAICVDRRFLILGSTNLTAQSIGKNFETNVFCDDPKIANSFQKYFNYYCKGGVHGRCKLKAPLFADGDFLPELLAIIKSAKNTLSFSIYFFDHPQIIKGLTAAHKRGVKVTGFIHSHSTFAMDYVRRTEVAVKTLSAAGLRALFFAPKTLFTHSKFLVADEAISFLGTGNWIEEDVLVNPQLYIRVQDKEFSRILSAKLEAQIKDFGTQV